MSLPTLSRRFPESLIYLLPLRRSMLEYKTNMGRVITSNDTPESDGDDLSDGRIFTMAACPPILGHGVIINGHLSTYEAMYLDTNDHEMADAVSKLPMNSLKWLVGSNPNNTYPTPVRDLTLIKRATEVYISGGPLYLYDNHAVVEAMNYSPYNSFWLNLYPPLESVECYYGLIRVIHDNTTISLGTMASDENELNIKERVPKREHMGFLDAYYTPSSKAAGKVRTLVFSV